MFGVSNKGAGLVSLTLLSVFIVGFGRVSRHFLVAYG